MQMTIEALDEQAENKGRVQFPPALSPMRNLVLPVDAAQPSASEIARKQLAASSTLAHASVRRKVDPFSRSQSVNHTAAHLKTELKGLGIGGSY